MNDALMIVATEVNFGGAADVEGAVEDSLRRDDLHPTASPKTVTVTRMHWAVMLGDGSRMATNRLYLAPRAKRYVRLAKRWGIDVYSTRFGKVRLPA
jgi:hypothetical protein